MARHLQQRGGLDGDDHQVLHAQLSRAGAGLDGMRRDGIGLQQAKPMRLQGFKGCTARDHAHMAARCCQPGPQPAANGPSAVNADVLQVLSGQISFFPTWNIHSLLLN